MTTPYARGSSRARAAGGLETPFDWSDQALAHPKFLVVGAKGSGKRQYLASLPYAKINWESREDIIGVVPAGADTVARMASALYYPGDVSQHDGPGTYDVFARQRTVRREGVLGGKTVTLAELPTLVFRDPRAIRMDQAVWLDNLPVSVGAEVLPMQEHLATALGIIFIVDPFVPVEQNVFVADVLEAIEGVHTEWREAGVSSLPTGERRMSVAVVVTKTDALHPGDPRLDDVILLRSVVGDGQTDRINATDFRVHCAGVSAWGEGPGVRYSGTRFEPKDVLVPLQELYRSLPRVLGPQVWDISRIAE